jgi:hypothetical protein
MHEHCSRHWPKGGFGRLAVVLLVAGLPSRSVSAQAITYRAGFSSSWGESSSTVCTLTCGPGESVTHEDLAAPMAGVTLSFRAASPVRFETGVLLTRKGWSVTSPTLRKAYLELPALVHVGYWPRSPGFGFSVGAGAALDVGLPRGGDSQVTTLFDGSLYGTADGRSLWSFSVRVARGLNRIHTFHMHTVSLVLGFAPAHSAP